VCPRARAWWWSGPQGHTCTWRLFEAATVGRYGAQQLERESCWAGEGRTGRDDDGMGRPKDGSCHCHCTRAVCVVLPCHRRPGRPHGGHACAAQRMHAACRTRGGDDDAGPAVAAAGVTGRAASHGRYKIPERLRGARSGTSRPAGLCDGV
jgi:hypothetical protein